MKNIKGQVLLVACSPKGHMCAGECQHYIELSAERDRLRKALATAADELKTARYFNAERCARAALAEKGKA